MSYFNCKNYKKWKIRSSSQKTYHQIIIEIAEYAQGGHEALVNDLILNISYNLSTSEYREYLREKNVSIPLNNGLLTALQERLQMFNPASSASSSRSAENVETKATVKLSEFDYKDLIKIISEQMVRDGEGLDIKRYINILDQFSENINRDNKRLESRKDDGISLVQSLIEDYCSGSSLSDLKEALAREQALTDDKVKLQIVEPGGFLAKILAKSIKTDKTPAVVNPYVIQ